MDVGKAGGFRTGLSTMLEGEPVENAFGPRQVYPPRNFLRGRRRSIDCLNFRAARRAACFPPYTLSLNILVTTRSPRRKWTWNPCVCFFARGFVSMRRMFSSDRGLGRFRRGIID